MSSKSTNDVLLKLLKAKKLNIPDITNFLKNNETDLNILDNHGYNLFHYAIKSESFEIANLMLNLNEEDYRTLKADPNVPTSDNTAPVFLTLNYVNDNDNSFKIIKSLIKAGADIKQEDTTGCNLIHRAAEKGRIEIIDLILKHNENLNKTNTTNINNELANDLADTNTANNNENSNIVQENLLDLVCKEGSALHFAIIGDQEDTVRYLLDNNIDLSLKDSNGNTALLSAIQNNMFNSFKEIIDYIKNKLTLSNEKKKVIFNMVNNEGNTILHELAYYKSSTLIDYVNKFSEEYRVNTETKNREGYTYQDVTKNLQRLQKEREDRAKLEKELIRKEKERIAEEKKQEIIQEKERIEKLRLAEEQSKQRSETLIKYRGFIFGTIIIVFFAVLIFLLNNAATKKKKEIVL